MWLDGTHINGIQFNYKLVYNQESAETYIIGKKQLFSGDKKKYRMEIFDLVNDYLKSVRVSLSSQGYVQGLILQTKLNKEFKCGNTQNVESFKIEVDEVPSIAFGGLMILKGKIGNIFCLASWKCFFISFALKTKCALFNNGYRIPSENNFVLPNPNR